MSAPAAPPHASPRDGEALISRADFVAAIRDALARGSGYAAGKLGYSHVRRLGYRVLHDQMRQPQRFLAGMEPMLHFESLNQLGIFPADLAFYPRFDAFWTTHLRALDCIGIFPNLHAPSRRILRHFGAPGRWIDYHDQEPDRSTPSRDAACYLPLFAGRRLLLVCPFADLLRARATRATFEAVWAKTGKRWFAPAAVEALEIPYGFAADTRARYANAIELCDAIAAALDRRAFDVALIAAAGLAVPLAAHVKARGRLAIDLGGHLQVLFGVLGRRWREQRDWRERYVTDAWIDMPARYRPAETDVCDAGAYW